MNIIKKKIKHPQFNRDIYIILIDNKLDRFSFEFLVYMARYGGHKGGIVGRMSHKGIADKLVELFFHLDDIFGIKWNKATEYNVRIIRDRMVGLENKQLKNPVNGGNKEIVKYDTADDKLRIWFKFFMFAQKKFNFDIILNYKLVPRKRYKNKSMLSHISDRIKEEEENNLIRVWDLLFNKKNRINSKKALSIDEFNALLIELEKIDLVYCIMAIYAVKTALRIGALFEIKESDFDNFFKIIKSKSKTIQKEYTAKYDKQLYYTLSIDLLKTIKSRYLIRELPTRLNKNYEYCKKKNKQLYNKDLFWIRSDGKEVKQNDFREALCRASYELGKVGANKITPHTFRHTAATWKVLNTAKLNNINLKDTGYIPAPILTIEVQKLLGHCSLETIIVYISSAIEMLEVDSFYGIIRMPEREFLQSKNAQILLLEKATKELGESVVCKNNFNLLEYGKNIGQII